VPRTNCLFKFLMLAVCVGTVVRVFTTDAAQKDLPRDTLWEVVHNVCVPGQSRFHDPKPCLRVELSGGIDKGFAVLKDPRATDQFIVVPTIQISGIESPILLASHAPNYFASAWEARTFVEEALHRTLPRDGIGLAINSLATRSQDQLHIHVACANASVLETLHGSEGKIGDHWAPFAAPLSGRRYAAMWVTGEDLSSTNPFKLLAAGLPGAAKDMSNHTLAVIGLTRIDGTKGFVLLARRVEKQNGILMGGEELLDGSCLIAALQK
jgi:CDP-diacylglycerol pyrophosphatase